MPIGHAIICGIPLRPDHRDDLEALLVSYLQEFQNDCASFNGEFDVSRSGAGATRNNEALIATLVQGTEAPVLGRDQQRIIVDPVA